MIDVVSLKKEHLPFVEKTEAEIFSDPWTGESIRSHLASPWGKSYAALSDGMPAGYLLSTLIAGEGEVLRIATVSAFRRRGVARHLLSRFLEDAAKEAGSCIFLEVRSKNLPAHKLYEAMGFTAAGLRKNYYKAPSDDAVLYQYQIKG